MASGVAHGRTWATNYLRVASRTDADAYGASILTSALAALEIFTKAVWAYATYVAAEANLADLRQTLDTTYDSMHLNDEQGTRFWRP